MSSAQVEPPKGNDQSNSTDSRQHSTVPNGTPLPIPGGWSTVRMQRTISLKCVPQSDLPRIYFSYRAVDKLPFEDSGLLEKFKKRAKIYIE